LHSSHSRISHPLSDAGVSETAPSLAGITLRPEPLARSPLAVVYRGWDRTHRCEVIVKVQRATDDPVTVSRFGREAAVMLCLRHPSIVTLYAFQPGDAAKNDPAALVMEYVPGTTLAALVAADGWLAPDRAVQLIEEIAAALDCVHALGIVHRDIKPSNILLPKHGPAKLTDFGIARMDDDSPLTVMGDILGTIEYASPEQVHGNGSVDARSDVYSLAAVSYFVLTGTPPFRAADASTQAQLSVMHRQVFSNPPPLRLHRDDLSPAIEDAVLRGLAKAPEARYASAGQLAAALRAAVAAADEPRQAAMDASARRTGMIAGAAAGAVLLAGLALWTVTSRSQPPVTAPMAVAAVSPAEIRPGTEEIRPAPSARHVASKTVLVKPAPAKTASVKTMPAKTASAKTAPAKAVPVKAARKVVLVAHTPTPSSSRLAATKPQMHPRIAAAVPKQRLPLVHKTPVKTAALRVPTAGLAPAAETRPGWYTVSGWIALAGQSSVRKPQLVRASPLWIEVDGHPLPSLASGNWAALPAGKHLVTFQPAVGLGVGPKTWTIQLAASGHLSQQIPLPPTPLPDIPTHMRNP